LDNLSR